MARTTKTARGAAGVLGASKHTPTTQRTQRTQKTQKTMRTPTGGSDPTSSNATLSPAEHIFSAAVRPGGFDELAGHTAAAVHALEPQLPRVAWLDHATANALRRLVALLAVGVPGVRAILLFGSVARHEARPLTDPAPSDVDLLVVFDPPLPSSPTQRRTPNGAEHPEHPESLTTPQQTMLSQAVVQALLAFPAAARDLHVTGAIPPFTRWDPSFLEHIAQDGLLLWAATAPPDLPAPLDALGQRALPGALPALEPHVAG